MKLWPALLLVAACGGGGDDSGATELPAWDKTLPDARVMGTFSGKQPARGIIHLHSVYSHDACDGEPRAADGTPNEPCLQDLRAALCTDRIDFAAITDHDDTMADEDFATLFSPRAGDEAVLDGDSQQIASRMRCDNGQEVLLTVGGENELMPIMLDHHVPGTIDERHAVYNADTPEAATILRDAGATLWVAHSEQRTTEHLLDIAPDGIELYNLHANIDPDIRSMYLGLDAYGAITEAVEFADTNPGSPEPDLALLAFLTPNTPALTRYDELLAAGRKVAGSAGSDAHEDALPVILADGERGDSYRRVLRWFSNIALVDTPQDIVQIEDAVRAGRMFSVFELLGTPEGFAIDGVELGATVNYGTQLHVTVPTVRELDPSLPAPAIHARVLHIGAGASGPEVAGESDGDAIDVTLAPGAYRIEVSMVPHHLGPYLRDLGTALADVELPWIYTSAFYVE
jgi:hypothetical protein